MLNSNIKEFNSFAESPKLYNSYFMSHTHMHLLFLSETLYNIKSPAFWFLSSLLDVPAFYQHSLPLAYR